MEASVLGAIIGSSITVAGSWLIAGLVVSYKLGNLTRKVDQAKTASDKLAKSQDDMSEKVSYATMSCDNLAKTQAQMSKIQDQMSKTQTEMGERVARIEGLLNGRNR